MFMNKTNTALTAETITTAQIKALRDESIAAGNHSQAWVCEIALADYKPAGHPGTAERAVVLRGWQAVEYATEYDTAQISKYADPTEGARTGLNLAEAKEIHSVDPGLIWIVDDVTAEQYAAARGECADAINAGQASPATSAAPGARPTRRSVAWRPAKSATRRAASPARRSRRSPRPTLPLPPRSGATRWSASPRTCAAPD